MTLVLKVQNVYGQNCSRLAINSQFHQNFVLHGNKLKLKALVCMCKVYDSHYCLSATTVHMTAMYFIYGLKLRCTQATFGVFSKINVYSLLKTLRLKVMSF